MFNGLEIEDVAKAAEAAEAVTVKAMEAMEATMEKKLYNLKIDPELEHLFPPLAEETLHGLTKSIINDGCIEPIVVWNETIIDGHNRYRICWENSIPFEYIEKKFLDKEDAKLWMFKKQSNRRNIPAFQRCELVYHLKEAILKEVEQNRREAISNYQRTGTRGTRSIRTADRLASCARVSSTMWKRANFIIEHADETMKERIRAEELSIRKAYDTLRAADCEHDGDGANNVNANKINNEIPDEAPFHEAVSDESLSDEAVSGEKEAVSDEKLAEIQKRTSEIMTWAHKDANHKIRDEIPEPTSELIAGFKTVVHTDEEDEENEQNTHGLKRNPGPFYYVKHQTGAAMKRMLNEVRAAIYQLSDDDIDKCDEISAMIDEACQQAKDLINQEKLFHSK